ncbi:MAG: hypothetical protein L0Y72_15120 [Gemmataceae bacterium]|nr:hypothetical protein [Gemmataceae bacterium]MCI0740375.1 hypothetical protein [Gemmataceae bacterium]
MNDFRSAALVLAFAIVGCGDAGKGGPGGGVPGGPGGPSGGPSGSFGRQTMSDLQVIGLAYHNYVDSFNKGAPNAEELRKFLTGESATTYTGLRDGIYVIHWGTRFLRDMPEGSSRTILGYHKDTPANGGLALFGDGSVREVTAQEFATTPRPKGK